MLPVKAIRHLVGRNGVGGKLRLTQDELLNQNIRLETLYRVGQMLNSTLETDRILNYLSDLAMKATRATHGQVLVVGPDSDRFERRALRGFSREEASRARSVPLPLHQGVNGRAYRMRWPVCVDDVQLEPDYFPLIPATRAELAIPIMRDGHVLGNLDLQSPEVGAFRDAPRDYLNALADRAAIAIENARLFEAEREQRLLAEALRETAATLSGTLNLESVLDRILDNIERVVPHDMANIMLVRGKLARMVRRRVAPEYHTEDYDPSPEFAIEQTPTLRTIIETGKPLIIPEIHDYAGWVPRRSDWWKHAYVGVPICVFDTIIGFLTLVSATPGAFTGKHAQSLELFAHHAATAIANAQLYEQAQQELAQRRRAEAELKEMAAELARSNHELQQFAYVASHDLQEPLRMVTSYTQLLARRYQGRLDGDADEFIAFAVDGATRMQRLISDLLAYSRVGTHGKALEPTDCSAACETALDNLKLAVEGSGAQVSVEPLPTVSGDASQLTQLFQNLIGNAIKFRGKEPPRVRVSARRQKGDWIFTVSDNGIGIDPQYAERIFMPFQRLHTREEYEGNGIGLAVCRKIVQRHGGRIWVESEPGRGATFTFTIPATITPQEKPG